MWHTPLDERLESAMSTRGASNLAVLVVDDEERMTVELAEALSDDGYVTFTATSAREALDLLASNPSIAVMISDIRMPDCDGIELTRQVLHNRGDELAVEVILVTGHAMFDDTRVAVAHGAFDFLRKPFKLNDIYSATERAMQRSSSRRQSASMAS